MTLYLVDGGDSPRAFGTKAEAFAHARTISRETDAPVFVQRAQTGILDKSAILRLINGEGGYVAASADLAEFMRGRLVGGQQ